MNVNHDVNAGITYLYNINKITQENKKKNTRATITTMFRRTQLRIKKLYNISMTIEFQEFYQKKLSFKR